LSPWKTCILKVKIAPSPTQWRLTVPVHLERCALKCRLRWLRTGSSWNPRPVRNNLSDGHLLTRTPSMDFSNHQRTLLLRAMIFVALALGFRWIVTARADQFPADPVESLHRVLKSPLQAVSPQDADLIKRLETAKPEERIKIQSQAFERNLTRKVDAIHQIGD